MSVAVQTGHSSMCCLSPEGLSPQPSHFLLLFLGQMAMDLEDLEDLEIFEIEFGEESILY